MFYYTVKLHITIEIFPHAISNGINVANKFYTESTNELDHVIIHMQTNCGWRKYAMQHGMY